MVELGRILESHDIDAATLAPWRDGHRLAVARGAGVATWLALRGLAQRTGLWPVLTRDEGLAESAAARRRGPTAARILEAARSIDPAEWLRSRHAELLRYLEESLREEREADGEMIDWLEMVTANDGFPRGEWGDAADGPKELQTTLESLWHEDKSMAMLLLPAAEGWHVPAVLPFGGWNDCPPPEVQAAMLADWGRRYDAEVMAIDGDVLELRVRRPPRTRDEAIALAKEQYLYCSDIVNQGAETIDALASNLLGNPVWYFWWD